MRTSKEVRDTSVVRLGLRPAHWSSFLRFHVTPEGESTSSLSAAPDVRTVNHTAVRPYRRERRNRLRNFLLATTWRTTRDSSLPPAE
jgi:hypothetical protein